MAPLWTHWEHHSAALLHFPPVPWEAGKMICVCPEEMAAGWWKKVFKWGQLNGGDGQSHQVPSDICILSGWAPSCGCLSVHPTDICPAFHAPDPGPEYSHHLCIGPCWLERKPAVFWACDRSLQRFCDLSYQGKGRVQEGKRKESGFFFLMLCSCSGVLQPFRHLSKCLF